MILILCNALGTLITLVLFLITAFYISVLKKKYKFWKELGVACPEPRMFWGNTSPIIRQKVTEAEFFGSLYKKYKDEKYIGFYNLWKPALLVRDPGLAKTIMEKESDHFTQRKFMSFSVKTDSVIISLLWLKGDAWKSRRAVFSKLFTPKRMKENFEDMQSSIPFFMGEVEDLVGKDMDPTDTVRRHVIRSVSKFLFGLDVSRDEKCIKKFSELLAIFSRPSAAMVLKIWANNTVPALARCLRLAIFPPKVYEFFSELMEGLVKKRIEGNIEREDLVDKLMKMKQGLAGYEKISYEECVGHMYVFFQSSFDTTDLTVCHALLQLSMNRSIQERARHEVDSALQGRKDVTYDQLSSMNYLEAVINEVLRLYPAAGVMDRICTKPYKVDDRLTIQRGMVVQLPVTSIQTDPDHFPDPDKFDPERFYSKDESSKGPWLPFGAGPRICIGMRLGKVTVKLVLAKILLEYVVLPSDKMTLPMKFDPQTFVFTARPVHGFWIKLQKRNYNIKT